MTNLLKHIAKDGLKWLELQRVGWLDGGRPCIFRPKAGAPGLFSYVVQTMGFVRYTHRCHLTPVIDLQAFPNTYLSATRIGQFNAWEYYFEQPAGLSLSDVDDSLEQPHVFDTTDPHCAGQLKMPWWDWECFDPNSVTHRMWRAYGARYIHLSRRAWETARAARESLFRPGERVLGIQCRGTDYTARRLAAHPVQPSPEMLIAEARHLLDEGRYDRVFLATEDAAAYRKFEDAFGSLLFTSDTSFLDYDGHSWINRQLPADQQAKLDHGMAYLVSMCLLACCNGFVAGRTSGSICVMLFTPGFDYSHIYDLGTY